MANLQDQLFNLTNPAPLFNDPEADSEDETVAKLVDQDEDFPDEFMQSTQLRRKAAIITLDTDRRYAGRKTSRKDLNSDESLSDKDEDSSEGSEGDEKETSGYYDNSDDDVEEEDDSEEEDISNFKSKLSASTNNKEFTSADDGDYSKYDDDDEDEDEDEGSEENEDEDDEEGDEDMSDIEDDDMDDGIQKFSSSADDEVAKGKAAKQQLGLWDSLLEGRIKLQKAVSIVNQLPQSSNWQHFTRQSAFSEEAAKTQQVVKHLLDSLVHLQDVLMYQNTETRQTLEDTTHDQSNSSKNAVDTDPDDEEIPSDSEEEEMKEEKNDNKAEGNLRKRKLKLDEYPGFLKKRHEQFSSYRDRTIQRWFDKTRLASGKMRGKSFAAFEQSVLSQINQILGDKERLIKRTQLKRSIYRVLGTTPTTADPEQVATDTDGEKMKDRDHLKDYDEEIFDDDDFYHQLLRELIERKTVDINDPVALSRQWLEIQKLRTKTKKQVDTKASKGRKLRYDIHKKMVNFMTPVDNCEWSEAARDDLFKSLFGKRFTSS